MLRKLFIIGAIFASSFANAFTLIASMESEYVTSTVYQHGLSYRYEYRVDSKIDNKKITNITIDLCDVVPSSVTVYEKYVVSYDNHSMTFSDIKPKKDEFVFSYYSHNVPNVFDMNIETSRGSYTNDIYSSSCNIPEPSVIPLLFTALFLTRKRR